MWYKGGVETLKLVIGWAACTAGLAALGLAALAAPVIGAIIVY